MKTLAHWPRKLILLLFLAVTAGSAHATATVNTLASASVSADTAKTGGSAAFTSLTGPVVIETDGTGMPVGTMILNAPSGYEFDMTADPVTITSATGSGGGIPAQINTSSSTTGQGTSKTVTPTANTITIYVTTASTGNNRTRFTWSGIRVRPINGTPLATQNITYSGSSTGIDSGANMGTLTEVAGTSSKLVFTTTAQTLTAGTLSGTVTVQRQDQFGNPNTADATITVNLTSDSTGTYAFRDSGDTVDITSVTIANGAHSASFRYKDQRAGTPTLTATKAGLTSGTQQETVNAGAASKLAIQTQPSPSATAGAAFSPQPVIIVQDAYGNRRSAANGAADNSTVVTAARSAGSGTLQGTLTATASDGLATFANLSHQVANTITIQFTSGALTPVTSGNVVVNPATADRLVLSTAPGSAIYGSMLSPQPVLKTRDPYGNDSTVGLGASKAVTLTLTAGSGSLTGTTSLDIGTGAGNGTVTFTDLKVNAAGTGKQVTAAASGLTSAVSGSFTISQATVTGSITADNKIYDGGAAATIATRSLTGVIGTDDVSLSGGTAAFADKVVGNGKTVTATGLSLTGTQAGNYQLASSTATTTANITKATVTGSITADNKIYDGGATATIATRSLTGVIGTDDVSLSGGTAAFADKVVGNGKTVTATGLSLAGADASNYQLASTTATATANITKATVTGSVTADNKVYDGDAAATIATRSLTGAIGGDTVTLTGGTATFANKNVGNGKTVTATGLSLTGADADNYQLASTTATTTANITAAGLTVSGMTATSRAYDGTATAAIGFSGASLVGVIEGDTVGLDSTAATATFANKNAGVGKTVTASGVALNGTDAGNYTLTQPTATAGITPRTLNVSATGVNKTYDGNTSGSAALSDDRVAGDTLTVSYTAAVFPDKNVGTGKAVNVTGINLGGADAANYSLASTTAATAADITQAPVTGSITANSRTYDGGNSATIATRSLAGVIGADNVNLSGGTATFADRNAGNGKTVTATGLSLSGTDAGNYQLASATATTTANITAATVTGSVTANNKTYDGNATATIATRSLSGVLGSDVVSLTGGTATFANKNVGNGKTVTATGLSLTGGDAGNYALASSTATTTANITAKGLTLTGVTANNKAYDGTTEATVNTGAAVLNGVVSGDSVSVDGSGATGAFDTKDAGTGKTVTVSGLGLSGTDAGNYTLAQPSTTANISQRVVQVTGTRVYDRTYEADAAALTIANNVDDGNLILSGSVTLADRGVGAQNTSQRTVARVQSATGNTSGGQTSFTVTLGTAPVAGNTLVAVISTRGTTADRVSGVSQAGATWSRVSQAVNANGTTTEIWYAPNAVGAGTALTVSLASSLRAAAVVMEYRGILSVGASDQAANATGSGTSPVTGTTPASSQANEVWIGGIGIADSRYTLSGYANGFASPGNASSSGSGNGSSDARVYALEKIVTATGTASSGGTLSGGSPQWSGAIATFCASPTTLGGAAAGNYTLAGLSGSVTITARALTVTGVTANNKPYDGTTAATLNTTGAALVGVVEGDTVNLNTVGATGVFADPNLGNGKAVTVSGLTITGADAGNYSLTQPTTTANITQRTLTVSATGVNKTYDGTTAATVTLSDDRIAGDDLTASYTTASFANKNAGTAKSVSVGGIAISGPDAGKYSLASTTASTTANIAQRTLAVGATGVNKVYDATTAATVMLADDRIAGDVLSASYAVATFADKNVGSGKAVSVSGIAIGGTDSSNYALGNTAASATASITTRSLVVSATSVNKVYDATPVATVTLSDNRVSGDVLTTSYASAAFADKNVGTAKPVSVGGIAVSGTDAGNYSANVTASTTANITAAGLTITGVTANNKVYDGGTVATLGGTPAPSGVLGSDVVTIAGTPTASFASKTVANNKPVTVSGYTLGGADAGNYALTQPAGLTANITAATVTGNITANSKTYDATTAATIATRTLGGVIGADAVSLTGGTATFADKNAGNGKTVTATGLGLSGADAGNYQLASTTATCAANITPAALTVTADARSRTYGAANPAFTASYSGFAGGETLPTSGVTGSPSLATTATPESPVSGGPYTITAALGTLSANNYTFSFVNGQLTVTKATLTVTADNKTRVYGAANPTFTATYSGFVNGETLPTSGVTGSPSLTTTATPSSPVSGSPYTIAAAMGTLAAGNYSFTFANGQLSVTKADTATAVTASANPSVFGQTVTFTATVSAVAPGSGTPSGTVQFKIDGVNFGAPVTLSGGVAVSGATSSLSVGAHVVTAVYSGDSDFNGSTSPDFTQTVNSGSTTTAVASSANPAVYGQPVTFTATVSTGGGTPTGTVQFKVDGANFGAPVTLSGGVAILSGVTSPSVGAHTVVAVYSGDGTYSGSTSPNFSQTVNKAGATANMTASSGQTVYGQPLTLTATVAAAAPGSGIPTGMVTFYQKRPGGEIATVPLDASGVATVTTAWLDVGHYAKAHVEYFGDGNFTGCDSPDCVLDVNRANTVTTVASSVNPSVYGQPVTFTATVTVVAPGAGTPAGTVTFTIDGVAQPAVTLNASGQASLTTSTLGVGSHTVGAAYAQSANYNASSGTLTGGQTVNKAASSAGIAASVNPSAYGQSVTFTATIAAVVPSAGVPTGSVTFEIDGTPQPPAILNETAQATISTSVLSVGAHRITATYDGDGQFLASASGALDHTVDQAALTAVVTVDNKVYDGTTAATIATRSLLGTVPGEDVRLVGGDAVFADKDAGNGKPVTVTGLSITGAAAANYRLASATATCNAAVTPATLTVTAQDAVRAYHDPDPAFAATYGGFVPGEDLGSSGVSGSPALTTTATLTSPVGTYPIVAALGTLGAPNYTFQFVSGTLTVTAGPLARLQVLAPGETAAPATPTGKTGTPDLQVARAPFSVTVNAVDAYWNVVTLAADRIHVTSTDAGAVLPADTELVAGTIQLPVSFRTLGTWTLTASSLTHSGATPDTSAPITVILAPPSQLGFTVEPQDTTAGVTMDSLVVQVQDAYGNAVPQGDVAVALTLNGSTLHSGTLTGVTAADGSVAFGDLVVRQAAGGLTFTAVGAPYAPGTSQPFSILPDKPVVVRVETKPNGLGTVVPPQTVQSRRSITVYSITRDAYANFVENVAADSWDLRNTAGGIVPQDLVPSPNMRSARFVANQPGSASIRATSGALPAAESGTIQAIPPNAGTIFCIK